MSSLPKKNSRVVHLFNKPYRYLIKYNFGADQTSLFIQENKDEPGNVLKLNADMVYPAFSAGIKPGDIVEVIRQAIEAGWEPSKKGSLVRMTGKYFDCSKRESNV